ncbi:transglycosylase SLT domain-containing protein [Methylomicrobium sp. Wu6]|uniref:transglycosylase SLT domain-containing protein n=1 Tax=Methylomicrobium sp. Wu6 TaxID=3107928 RepID=UPI002DD6876F|nr:transglycosylase SLT domain-containing protein [Methylomicrobium sp. Wu6]MEC4747069.1 transglycosylase SLT domain-containing protein [Methylomicrobium sp. Wu6]
MRSLLLVLTIAIGVFLFGYVPGADAATSKDKAHAKKTASASTIDVWGRIRSGMKIPSPTPVNPANHERSGSKAVTLHSNSSTSILKMRQDSDGIARYSQSALDGPPQTAIAPVHRYTELGRLKLDQHHYTELGRKLLGAKPSATTESNCTPPPSVKRHKANAPETEDSEPALVKLKGRLKIADARPDFNQTKPNKELSESASRLNRYQFLTALSKSMRADESEKSASTCDERQLAAIKANSKQQKPKENFPEKQNVRGGQQSQQAAINDRIDKFIAAYTRNPDFLYRVAERAHPYLYHIVEKLSQYRLPLELALLPIVESAYQPTAESAKQAKGLWQFIPSTGMDYNLVQSHNYDERLDIPKSTQAAIRFLSGLNHHFNGDWLLALAAYNSGQATVDNAISHNLAEGLPADFWSLTLPEETQNYVPRLLALSKIFSHPANYGIKLPSIKNEPYFVKVQIDHEFEVNYLAEKEISTIARLANLKHDQFCRLNPSYLGSTLSRKRSYAFLMPPGNANELRQRLANIARFMSEPALPLKSIVLKEKPQADRDLYDPSLSLVSELVFRNPSDLPKFATPFLSLNVDGEQSILTVMGQPLV